MGFILKQIFAFLKLLNSDTGSNQIAAGIACGFILGMTPALSLQTFLVFLVIFFFRVQSGAAFLTAFFFKFIAYALDPVFHAVGSQVLELPNLEGLFTTMYNMPIIPLTRFNNSIVMGSGVVTVAFSPLVFFVSLILIRKYRELVVARFKATQFWKTLKATTIYQWYYKYDQLYGS